MELCWLTCVSSELNGGELTRSGGVDSLGRLMQRCLDVLPRDAAPTLPAVVIAMHCMRTFAGMASFPDAREQLQHRCASQILLRLQKIQDSQVVSKYTRKAGQERGR